MGMAKRHMEEVWARGFDDLDGEVCSSCLDNEALKAWIENEGQDGTCGYCGLAGKVVLGNELMQQLADGLEHEFGDADNEGIPYDGREGGYQAPLEDLEDIFIQAGWPFSNDELAEDVIEAFADVPRVSKYVWSLSPSEMLISGWRRFVEFTRHETRYLFLAAPKAKTADNWDEIPPAEMLDRLGEVILDSECIKPFAVGTRFTRARPHKKNRTLLSHQELGPPPTDKALYSNRMSPAGISMFYGALDAETAQAEVVAAHRKRPKAVTTGEFQTLRPLNLVDLVDLPALPSLFNERRRHLRGPIRFLHDFATAIAEPVSVDAEEHIEYVPTQIVTEYIREVLPARSGQPVDGILYRSAQREGGVNVVVFVGEEQCTTLPGISGESTALVLGLDASSVRRTVLPKK